MTDRLPRYVGPEVSASGRKMTPEENADFLGLSPLSLRQHLALLEQAGFSATDVLWKRFNFAVYAGVKAGSSLRGGRRPTERCWLRR